MAASLERVFGNVTPRLVVQPTMSNGSVVLVQEPQEFVRGLLGLVLGEEVSGIWDRRSSRGRDRSREALARADWQPPVLFAPENQCRGGDLTQPIHDLTGVLPGHAHDLIDPPLLPLGTSPRCQVRVRD